MFETAPEDYVTSNLQPKSSTTPMRFSKSVARHRPNIRVETS